MTRKTAARKSSKRVTPSTPTRYTVDRLDQVRLLAHPLRLKLFEAFAAEPRTTHQVARALGLAPTRLYHHVNALERIGLLQLKETRPVRGATEKYYQAAGRILEIEPGLFAGEPAGARGAAGPSASLARTREGIGAMVGQVLDGARVDLMGALERYAETPEAMRPVAARVIVHGSPAKIAALRRKVARWLAECTEKKGRKTKRSAARGGSRASLTLVFTAGPGSPKGSD